jgi:flagellar basal-body rod modification protein FlgD
MSAISNALASGAAAGIGGTSNSANQAAGKAAEDALANKEVFIQLLVAQLQNQNPMSPSDPIQFLTQLAQFTSLEQSLEMRKELTGIRTGIDIISKAFQPPPGSETEADQTSSIKD